MQNVLPDGKTETEVKNTIDIGAHSYYLQPRKNKIVLTQIQIYR
jgi:hypothetical protein